MDDPFVDCRLVEPYVCLECPETYKTCPDWDAHECPACGGKVMPKRLENSRMRLRGEYLTCQMGCTAEVERASGKVICVTCGESYYEHRYCRGSKFNDAYAAHVLCDGRHVHL